MRYAMCAILGVTGAAASLAHATVFSNLVEQGSTATVPQEFRNLSGLRDMAPNPHIVQSAFGDEARSILSLHASTALATMSVHACSGPGLNQPGGTGSGSGSLYYEEAFTIQSMTLPVGTPVVINYRVSVAHSFLATLSFPNPNAPPANDFSSIFGHIGIRLDTIPTTVAAFSGDFSGGSSGTNPNARTQSGLYGTGSSFPNDPRMRAANEFIVQVPGVVGGQFNMALQSTLSAGSAAGNPDIANAWAQTAIVWGAEVVGGAAQLRSPMDNFQFPSYVDSGPNRAVDNLPDEPLPAPGAAVACGLAAIGMSARRRR
jgi:hypothetical protein